MEGQIRLGSIFNLVGGGTPSTSKEVYWGTGTPWFSSADISLDGKINYRRNVTPVGIQNSTTNVVPAKTVVVVTRVGLGKVSKLPCNMCFSQDIQALQPTPQTPPFNESFLMYQLSHIMRRVKFQGRGTTISGITKKQLSDIILYLPPLIEQNSIVSRIEELFSQLDASVAELKTAKERLKVYRQAVLKEAFTKYHTFTSLKQISERIFDGPFGSNLKTSDYVEQGIRVVRLENLKNAWFDDTKRSFVTREKYRTISSHTVYPDDLIMSTFISENIKICQLPKEFGFAVNKADCVGIRLKSGINPRFIMFYLASREAYNLLIHQVHGATRPRVNTKQIKAMQVPFAKLCEQDATVTGIEEKMSICDSIEKTVDTALQQAEALRQSILKKAFEERL